MFRMLLIAIFTTILFGCDTVSTLVMDPADQPVATLGIIINTEKHNIDIPVKVVQQLQKQIEKSLYEDNKYSTSKILSLNFKFRQHDKGNQFSRWFWGEISHADEASLAMQITDKDLEDIILGQTQVRGKIGNGFVRGIISRSYQKSSQANC